MLDHGGKIIDKEIGSGRYYQVERRVGGKIVNNGGRVTRKEEEKGSKTKRKEEFNRKEGNLKRKNVRQKKAIH